LSSGRQVLPGTFPESVYVQLFRRRIMKLSILAATAIAATIAVALAAPVAHAQATYKRDVPDSLAKQAKITEDVATATAQKRVPKGKIEAMELEKEKGKLMYSFDIRTAGKSGIDEVNVSAMTGKIIGF